MSSAPTCFVFEASIDPASKISLPYGWKKTFRLGMEQTFQTLYDTRNTTDYNSPKAYWRDVDNVTGTVNKYVDGFRKAALLGPDELAAHTDAAMKFDIDTELQDPSAAPRLRDWICLYTLKTLGEAVENYEVPSTASTAGSPAVGEGTETAVTNTTYGKLNTLRDALQIAVAKVSKDAHTILADFKKQQATKEFETELEREMKRTLFSNDAASTQGTDASDNDAKGEE